MSNNHSQQHPHNTNEETQISAITEIHYLPNMTLSDIEPFCIGTGTTPRRHLQCRYYRFPNKNIFQTWLEDRKQIVHWVCDKAKPGKHSINLEFMQFECNFAGSYTQTSLNHINTTNDQESNDNNNNNNNNGDDDDDGSGGTNETGLVPLRKKRKRGPTIKTNCPAKIQMKVTPKDPDGIYVTWIYKHNHDVGTEKYFDLSRDKKNARRKPKRRKR